MSDLDRNSVSEVLISMTGRKAPCCLCFQQHGEVGKVGDGVVVKNVANECLVDDL